MKKIISVSIAMLLALLTVIPAFAAGYSCTLKPDKSSAAVGDTVTVSVNISAGLSGIEAVINYDASAFRFISSSKTNLMNTEVNSSQEGRIKVVSVALNATNAGTLATLKFEVLKTGGKISTSVADALDGNDNDVTSQVSNSSITISAGSAPVTQAQTSAPTTQPVTTQNNQQNSSQTNQGSASSSNSSANNPSQSNSNASVNNTTAKNATTQSNNATSSAEITTLAAEQVDATAPEVIANATEAVSDEAETLTTGETEEKSYVPLIVAIVVALASAAAIVIILVKKKNEDKETGI